MRICFQCDEYPPGPHGGIGTLIQLLARGLVRHGHQVRVIGIYPQAYPAADYEEDEGVRVWRVREPNWRFGSVVARWRVYCMIADWSRRGEIEVVEVSDYGAPAAGWPRLPVPVIARLSGSTSFFAVEMRRALPRRFHLEKASLRRADFWCSESRYLADRTRTLFRLRTEPAVIIYNSPVDLAQWTESCRSRGGMIWRSSRIVRMRSKRATRGRRQERSATSDVSALIRRRAS